MERRQRARAHLDFDRAVAIGAAQTHVEIPEAWWQQWERANNPLDDYSRTRHAKRLIKLGAKPTKPKLWTPNRKLINVELRAISTLRGFAFHWEAAAPRADHSLCQSQVDGIRAYHKTHGYVDIAYSWLFCNHGQVFYGRGWGSSAATCGSSWNDTYASACWLGGPGYVPTAAAFAAAKALANEAAARGAYDFIGHRDACSTQCPGDEIWHWVHSGMPGDAPAPEPPPPRANPGVKGMLCRDNQTGSVFLVGPGHAHHIPTTDEVNRLRFIGVPYVNFQNGLEIVGWGRTFGVPNWDQAATWQ